MIREQKFEVGHDMQTKMKDKGPASKWKNRRTNLALEAHAQGRGRGHARGGREGSDRHQGGKDRDELHSVCSK